jgi:hypothetical protein
MKARNFSNVRFAQAMTAVALGGALAMVACAGNGTSGGNGGSAGPTGQGGTSSNGGSTTNPGGNGGSTGGGSCPSTPSGGTVNFCNGKAQGAMTGVGWVTLGSSDSISDPTCDTDKHAITKANACTTTTNWSSSDGLCTSGSIPALPATPVQSDYDNNFGIEIGVNTSQPSDAGAGGPTLGGSYTSVTFTVSGTPTTGLRAQVHRLGDGDKGVFCATMTSGTPILLSSFNTQCWNGSSCPTSSQAPAGFNDTNTCYSLTAADIANIDHAHVLVFATPSAITVTDLCLKSIVFQ